MVATNLRRPVSWSAPGPFQRTSPQQWQNPSAGHRQTGAAHAFQVVVDAPFVAVDAFSRTDPCIVPARTLLSQLP